MGLIREFFKQKKGDSPLGDNLFHPHMKFSNWVLDIARNTIFHWDITGELVFKSECAQNFLQKACDWLFKLDLLPVDLQSLT